MKDTVLVTGGCGFLGSYMVEKLLNDDHKVIVIDIQNPEDSNLAQLGVYPHPNLEIRKGCINEGAVWEGLPDSVTRIVHTAAMLGIEKVVEEQIQTMDTSILGTRSCLDFASRLPNLKRFVYLSTSEVYGVSAVSSCEADPAEIPTSGGRWCYAASKLAAEFYVKAYAEHFGFEFTIIRPFNVYGAHRHSPNAMTTLAVRAVQGQSITVSGSGLQTRSWCHRKDFVEGAVEALFSVRGANQTFNLGNDAASLSIIGLAEEIRSKATSPSEIIVDGREGQDVNDRKPNIEKARELLGYKPTVAIEEGITDVLSWAKESHGSGAS